MCGSANWFHVVVERICSQGFHALRHCGVAQFQPYGQSHAPLIEIVLARHTATATALIDALEANYYSWTWPLDDTTRIRAAERTRAWATAEFGSLEDAHSVEASISWRAYHLP